MANPWWLYMLECRGGGIYTGIAIDVDERYKVHQSGKGAKYTKMNPPVRVLARKEFPDRRSAAQAEYEMKQLSPLEKWRWVYAFGEDNNQSDLTDVADRIQNLAVKNSFT